MNFTTILFVDLTNAQSLQLLNDMLTVAQKHELENYGILPYFTTFKGEVEKTNLAYRPDNDVFLTKQMVSEDDYRDSCIILLCMMAEAYSRHFDTEKKEAGLRICSCIDKYGPRIYKQSYQAESSAITNIYVELTTVPILMEAVVSCGLSEEVEEMNTANEAFKATRMERVRSRSERDELSFAEKLDEGVKACKTFFRKIDACIILNEELDYTPLIKEMNVLIEEANFTALRRKARSKEEEQEAPQPTNGEVEEN